MVYKYLTQQRFYLPKMLLLQKNKIKKYKKSLKTILAQIAKRYNKFINIFTRIRVKKKQERKAIK